MRTANQTGRIIGVLLLFQMVISFSVNFVLLEPVFNAPGFLVNAAAHPSRMALAALLGFVTGLLSVGLAVTAFRVFRQNSEALALWLIALAAVGLAINVVESISVMSLLSLSEAYARAIGTQRDLFPSLRGIVASARNWAHYFGLIVSGSDLFVFYVALLRLAVLPRALAALGVAAVSLQLTAVSMPLFGHDVVFPMLAPLGVVQLTAAGWMLVKGWRQKSNFAKA
jgi:hypothetical protein